MPPSSSGRIVGVVPVASPIVGNLALARLAGGQLEMVNLAIMALQVCCLVLGFRRGGLVSVFRSYLQLKSGGCCTELELGAMGLFCVVTGGLCSTCWHWFHRDPAADPRVLATVTATANEKRVAETRDRRMDGSSIMGGGGSIEW